jgi:hypothetical protein
MRRMLWAGLLALPVLLASAGGASAQGCSSCGPFAGGGRANGWYGSQGPYGCGGMCLKLFGTWMQNGPLVNYGPYEGYYPFAPYGPWTSDLRYTGPNQRYPSGGGCNSCGLLNCRGGCGGLAHFGGLLHKKECGDYALATFRNVFHRCHPCGKGNCGN